MGLFLTNFNHSNKLKRRINTKKNKKGIEPLVIKNATIGKTNIDVNNLFLNSFFQNKGQVLNT